ncbi:hypothetical protein [Anaerovibrio sp. RM50]|uniref:hypothetical protein n=1 Tax=Anaerovibrio sp. RM50 TaxID=1200557 RepID=UPI0012EB9286|nr:hypothetical protein [Anaerovibrio sp. RM50]
MAEKNTKTYPIWKNGKILFKGIELTEDEALALVMKMEYGDPNIDKQMEIDIRTEICGMPLEKAIDFTEGRYPDIDRATQLKILDRWIREIKEGKL